MRPAPTPSAAPSLAPLLTHRAARPLLLSGLVAVCCAGAFWVVDRIGTASAPPAHPAPQNAAGMAAEEFPVPPANAGTARRSGGSGSELLDGTPDAAARQGERIASPLDTGTGAKLAAARTDAKPPRPGLTKPAATPTTSLASDAPRSTMSLALTVVGMLAALGVVLFFMRRALRGGRLASKGTKAIIIRDALTLGPKRAVYLLRIEGRSLVVGMSGDQMTLLSEFSEEPAPSAAESLASETQDEAEDVAPNRAALAAVYAAIASEPAVVEAPPPAPIPVEPPPPPPAPLRAAEPVRAEPAPAPPRPAARPPRQEAAAAGPRAFPFDYVSPEEARSSKKRAERVPPKFRHLLEQAAAGSQGGGA